MENWRKIIETFHAETHHAGEYQLVLGTPGSDQEITSAEEKLGVQFPEEFKTLYLTHDGFGFTNHEGKLTWAFIPLNQLPSFVEKIRSWFEDDKPDLARRFVPFFDWLDGGGCGYLLSRTGKLESRLYDFHPEQLSDYFKDSQDSPCHPLERSPYRSIKAFLEL